MITNNERYQALEMDK